MKLTIGLLAAGALIIGACGSGGEDKAEAPSSPSRPDNCEAITDTFGEAILEGTPKGARPLRYVEGAAVPTPSGSGAYYVAVRFDGGDGVGEQTGVWMTGQLDSGPIASVDGYAKEFTQWPTEDGLNVATPGARESKACLPSS